uniref:OB_Dis3 domain-containing protein n=1 Tax=Heterorhabditis bacteriophora TaxID=37862 RepID=A0A1I7WU23_HETBA
MFDSLAIVARINGSSGHRRAIRRIEKDGDFAVLSIHPLREEKLCPLKPAPARLSRLPLKVSLTETPWIGVNLDQLSEKTCRITGFTTHESMKSVLTTQLSIKSCNWQCSCYIYLFISSLRFSVFADTLPKLIKKVDVIEILQSTEKCFE